MRHRIGIAVVAVMVLAVTACAGGSGSSDSTTTTSGEEAKTMRFVFSPDPVWNWLEDQGILADMEAAANSRSSATSPRTSSPSLRGAMPTSFQRVVMRLPCLKPRPALRP